jgi:IclR family acetate operon transcriptional repressor
MSTLTHSRTSKKRSSVKAKSKPTKTIKRKPSSLEWAFRILEEIAAETARPSGLSFTEIKNELRRREQIPNSTLSNLLRSLKGLGHLHFDKDKRLHSLGYRFVYWGEVAKSRLAGRGHDQECIDLLKGIVDLTNCGAHIAGLRGVEAVYQLRVEAPGFFAPRIFPGKPQVPHVTAIGKALICCNEPDQVQGILDQHPNPRTITAKSITTLEPLMEHLAGVRAVGYAIDDEEHAVGVRCVAAPIYSEPNKVIASIGISARKEEVTLAKLKEYGEKVLKVAAEEAASNPRILEALKRNYLLSNSQNGL